MGYRFPVRADACVRACGALQMLSQHAWEHGPPASRRTPIRGQPPLPHELRWQWDRVELPLTEAREPVIFLPANQATAQAVQRLRSQPDRIPRAIT